MTPSEALDLIRSYGRRGWYVITRHAAEQMEKRGVEPPDVRHGLIYAASCSQEETGRWRVESEDCEGDALTLIVAIEADVIVVTVW